MATACTQGKRTFGKSWLASALGHKACRDNRSVLYRGIPKLYSDLALARGDGRYARLLRALSGVQLLILDDWGLEPLDAAARHDFLASHCRKKTIARFKPPFSAVAAGTKRDGGIFLADDPFLAVNLMSFLRRLRLWLLLGITLGFSVLPAGAEVLITIDKSAQRMTVAVDGKMRWKWPVSTGAHGYDTPSGSYTAFRMEKEYSSREWDDAPMPNSIFFTKRGHAIHGSYDKRLGKPVSHGCVRLSPANAAKLYDLVESQGATNAKVVVTGRDI